MASAAPLRFLTVNPKTRHTATVIFVHGLGDTGAGWKPVADEFKEDVNLSHVKWVFPHAPRRAVTANMGSVMPSWFDIISFGFNSQEDEAGMLQASRSLQELITAEVNSGIPASRIVLGGFSQGGAMSILAGLCGGRKLAGLVSLSGWVPLRHKFLSMVKEHAKSTPIFWGHGKDDQLVTYEMGKASVDLLKNQVMIPEATAGSIRGIDFNVYEGLAHATTQQELDGLRLWIAKAIPNIA